MDSATSQPVSTTPPWYHPFATELDWYFPVLDPLHVPLGNKVLVQLQRTKRKSAGGLYLPEDTRDTVKWNTQVAKVISIGPIAYHNRETNEPWPEGMWAKPGDFVRVPRWGGDRWELVPDGDDEPSTFVIFNDYEIFARVTGDPTQIKAFIL